MPREAKISARAGPTPFRYLPSEASVNLGVGILSQFAYYNFCFRVSLSHWLGLQQLNQEYNRSQFLGLLSAPPGEQADAPRQSSRVLTRRFTVTVPVFFPSFVPAEERPNLRHA